MICNGYISDSLCVVLCGMLQSSHVVFVYPNADWHIKEIQFDLLVLSLTKADIAILFIYSLLHNSPNDDVRS